jgi:hypothetical protein
MNDQDKPALCGRRLPRFERALAGDRVTSSPAPSSELSSVVVVSMIDGVSELIGPAKASPHIAKPPGPTPSSQLGATRSENLRIQLDQR